MTTIRTMIVEDDTRIAEIQKRFLEKMPEFEVVGIAHSIEDCEVMLDTLSPDLILLDVYFPDGNGLDLAKSIRIKRQQIEIILVTAAKDVGSLKKAMHSGVFDYVVKPLEFDRLRDSLRRFEHYFKQLNSLEVFQQSDIDSLLPRTVEKAARESTEHLPKGIDALTLVKIRGLFDVDNQSLGAEKVGQIIGVSRTTARRYLEFLVGNQELKVDVSYGGVGRPERNYCRV